MEVVWGSTDDRVSMIDWDGCSGSVRNIASGGGSYVSGVKIDI